MGSSDLDGRRFKPNIDKSRNVWRLIPTAAVGLNDIVAPNGSTSGYITCAQATSASATSQNNRLLLSKNAVVSADANTACLKAVEVGLITDVNTVAGAVGDDVYLSTAGGWSLTAGTFVRRIGTILVSSATVGVILFDGAKNSNRESNIAFGTVIVASGVTTGVVTMGAAWNGSIVVATVRSSTNLVSVQKAVIAGGDLTVTVSADPGVATGVVSFVAYKGTADFTDS
jgi:hypothetical protein